MASANLDLRDLNILLSTYMKDRLELKKRIENLKDIQSTETSLGMRVGKDFLKTYTNLDKIEADMNDFSEALSEIESKIPYIKGLIDKEESMATSF